MNNELFSFFLTCISGFSTLIGYLVINLKKDKRKLLASSLYFASGVMLLVSIVDLIPSSFNYINSYYFVIFAILLVLFFITLGIVISMLIDKFLPDNNDIYHLGIMTMLVIILHNLPEGIITYITTTSDMDLGIKLTLAIAMHNIPEGISIAVPIYYATKSKKKAFLYTLISGFSEPVGAIISYLFFAQYVNDVILGFLFSIIAGIMIHIACYELLPNAKKQGYDKGFWFFFLGMLVMLMSEI